MTAHLPSSLEGIMSISASNAAITSTTSSMFIASSASSPSSFAPSTSPSPRPISDAAAPAGPDIRIWALLSDVQYWVFLPLAALTLPLLLFGMRQLKVYLPRSHYFLFLVGICVANQISLILVIFELLSLHVPLLRDIRTHSGPLGCKTIYFLNNVAAVFANWTFVVMFAQRFALIFFPLRRATSRLVAFLADTKMLLAATLFFGVLSQAWVWVLITEQLLKDEHGRAYTTCGEDFKYFDKSSFKWVGVWETATTYLIPFLATLAVDLGVLVWSQHSSSKFSEAAVQKEANGDQKESSKMLLLHTPRSVSEKAARGKTLSSRETVKRAASHALRDRLSSGSSIGGSMRGTHGAFDGCVKIQSIESIRVFELCHKRRHRAIRRCLIMATVQVVLTLPYYTLQFIDNFCEFQRNTTYLCLDVVFYLLFLCQFPTVLVHIHFLVGDSRRASADKSTYTSTFSRASSSSRSRRPCFFCFSTTTTDFR